MLFAKLWRPARRSVQAKFCSSSAKAEPEDRIIRSPLDDDAPTSRDSLRARHLETDCRSAHSADVPDDDFLTAKLRFGKKTYPFPFAGPNPDDDRRGLAINRALRPDVVLIVPRSIGPTPWPAVGRHPRCACTSARRGDRIFCRRERSERSRPPGVGPRIERLATRPNA